MENSEDEYRSREMIRMDKAKLEAEILHLKDELKEYAKGGKVFSRDEINENDLDTIFVEGTRYDGDMFSENQETTDIDYVIDNWKDNRNVATYKIYLRFNNGDEKELVEGYSYAKGGTTDADYWKENKGDFAGYMEIDETEVDDDYIDSHFAKGGVIIVSDDDGVEERFKGHIKVKIVDDIGTLDNHTNYKEGEVVNVEEIDGDDYMITKEGYVLSYAEVDFADEESQDVYNNIMNKRYDNEYAKGGKIQINPNNHRYHILGYVKFYQKPELLATTNDKSEIKRIVNKIDFDKDKIFVTDDKEDRVVYNY